MANEYLNMIDLVSRKGSDQVVGLIEEVLTVAPEFSTLPVRTVPGTSLKMTLRTGNPTVGFRSANEGVETSKSRYEQKLVNLYFLDGQMEVDEAIVRGDDRELGDILTDEAIGVAREHAIHIGNQTYYGTSADAKGFQGYVNQVDSALQVNATGSTNVTSAWFVYEDLQGAHFVVGEDGALEMADEWVRQKIVRSSKSLMAFVNNLSGFIGLSIGSKNSIGRVANITAAKPLTDELGNELLSKFPLGRRPTRVYMNRATAFGLQKSRTAISQVPGDGGGSPAFAPQPTSIAGIPIVITDSINHTESDVSF